MLIRQLLFLQGAIDKTLVQIIVNGEIHAMEEDSSFRLPLQRVYIDLAFTRSINRIQGSKVSTEFKFLSV